MRDFGWAVLYFVAVSTVLTLTALLLLIRAGALEALLVTLLGRALRGPAFATDTSHERKCRVQRRRGGNALLQSPHDTDGMGTAHMALTT